MSLTAMLLRRTSTSSLLLRTFTASSSLGVSSASNIKIHSSSSSSSFFISRTFHRFSFTSNVASSSSTPASNDVSMTMYGKDFSRPVTGRLGETLLNVAQLNDVDQIEGACEGCMCCSTCHMIFDEATFKALGPVSDDEQDLIDRAAGATDTSRLGCQVRVTKALEGARIKIPSEFTNQMV